MSDPFSGEPPRDPDEVSPPALHQPDPRLTRMRRISAPIDEPQFRPRPPRGIAARVTAALMLAALAIATLAYAFLRASALG